MYSLKKADVTIKKIIEKDGVKKNLEKNILVKVRSFTFLILLFSVFFSLFDESITEAWSNVYLKINLSEMTKSVNINTLFILKNGFIYADKENIKNNKKTFEFKFSSNNPIFLFLKERGAFWLSLAMFPSQKSKR